MGSPRDLFDLSGRVAVVTGASSGLGRRAALALGAAGAPVVALARRRPELTRLCDEIGKESAFVVADVTDRPGLPGIVKAVSEPFGAPDILVHAAGINTRQHADEVTPEGWDQTMALNLSAPFFLSQAMIEPMRQKEWGRIVNFA